VERFERFFDGSGRIEAVNLIEVHVVELQTFEAGVDGMPDVLGRKPLFVGGASHRVEDLGGDDDLLSRQSQFAQGSPENLFASTERIHISSVEEVDSRFPCLLEKRPA